MVCYTRQRQKTETWPSQRLIKVCSSSKDHGCLHVSWQSIQWLPRYFIDTVYRFSKNILCLFFLKEEYRFQTANRAQLRIQPAPVVDALRSVDQYCADTQLTDSKIHPQSLDYIQISYTKCSASPSVSAVCDRQYSSTELGSCCLLSAYSDLNQSSMLIWGVKYEPGRPVWVTDLCV